jgi:hypothetical protein
MGRRPAIALAIALLLTGCGTTRVGEASTFKEAVGTYREADGRKALALASDEGGRRAWGAQYGSSLSEERSVREALEECEASAKRLGVQAQCYLFAVGERQSKSTLEKCEARRINPKRCRDQQDYAPLLE